MGQYSEKIKIREQTDRTKAGLAERYLFGVDFDTDDMPKKEIDEAMIALEYILMLFDQQIFTEFECQTISELFDCMLEPLGVLYEDINVSEGIPKTNRDCILAFREDGAGVVIRPAVIGQGYCIPSTGEKGKYTSSMKLKPAAYVINRPIPAKDFSLANFAGFVIKILSVKDWVLVAVLAALISMLGVAVPEINRTVLGTYTKLQINELGTLLILACAGLAMVYIARALFRCVKDILLNRIRLEVEKKVQSAFMARLLLLPMGYFRENASGRISTTVYYCKMLADLTVGAIAGTFPSAFFALAYIGEIKHISGDLLDTSVLIIVVQLVVMIVANVISAHNQRKIIDNDARLRDYNNMIFKGIQKIKTSGAENRMYSNWAWLYRKGMKLTFDPLVIVKIKPVLSMLIPAAGTIFLLLSAASGGVSGADYIAFMSVYSMVMVMVDQIISLSDNAISAGPYVSRLKTVLDAVEQEENISKDYVRRLNGSIQFDNVSLEYKENEKFKIENFSLNIRPGEKVAIVGASGCGKSSLINLLTGLGKPTSGDILIDGVPISRLNLRSLCRQIGSVSQFSRLFPGTVRFNVSLGNEAVTDEEIWKALKQASIDDVIRKTPLGLDTEISPGQSSGFSGGQSQCLLLARCFAGNRKLLILDEATSALDNLTQDKVLKSVYAMDATVVMVAHRLSTVRQCDRIFVFDNGRIVEEGNYEELIAQKGFFYGLVRKQLVE